MHPRPLLCLLIAVIALTVPPAATAQIESGPRRTPAFYIWSKPIPRLPGRLLRHEPLEPALRFPGAERNERILYVSTDGVGGRRPTTVSGAVFIPPGPSPPGGWPVIAWAHGTVGMADICAPTLQGRSLRDVEYLSRWLAAGFAIVATDYQGLGTSGPHPYMNARAEAYSVLDGLRAAHAGFPQLSGRTVLLGQSQGGQAAFAAAVYAKTYAPELDIRGTIATGTPYMIPGAGRPAALGGEDRFAGGPDATLYYRFYLFMMARTAQPGLDPAQALTPQGLELLRQAEGVCNNRLEADIRAVGANRLTAFRGDSLDRALSPVALRMAYPDLKAKGPVFLGIGEKDEEVSTVQQLRLATDACAAGTIVEAHLYAGASHGQAVNGSLAQSLPFARKVISGGEITPVCAPSAEPAAAP
jgi:pimeloyl-ACP methyl ester carboxylesterase